MGRVRGRSGKVLVCIVLWIFFHVWRLIAMPCSFCMFQFRSQEVPHYYSRIHTWSPIGLYAEQCRPSLGDVLASPGSWFPPQKVGVQMTLVCVYLALTAVEDPNAPLGFDLGESRATKLTRLSRMMETICHKCPAA